MRDQFCVQNIQFASVAIKHKPSTGSMLPSECFDSLINLMTRNWQVSELNDNDHSANDDEDIFRA